MNDIIDMLFSNFTTLSLLVGLSILMLTNKSFDRRTNRYFMLFILMTVVLIAADITDYYLASLSYPIWLRYVTSSLGYTIRPAAIALIISILLRRKNIGFILWIPIVLLALAAFTSYYTHLMFWFDDDNYFVRGVLGYSSHVISGLYMAMIVTLTIRMYRYISAGEIMTVLYIAFICAAATFFESAFGQKFLLPGAIVVSCAMYYTFLYVQTYKRDALTELLNRRSFYRDAERMNNQEVAVISMDLNDFKEINDSQGHGAGDKALQTFSDILQETCGSRYIAYRTGGDEFMALGRDMSPESAETFIMRMRLALKGVGLTASFGFDLYHPGDSFDDVCNRADAHMYSDKRRAKHRECERT